MTECPRARADARATDRRWLLPLALAAVAVLAPAAATRARPARPRRRAAAGRGRRRHRRLASGGLRHRAAGPARGLARGAGAGARRRHRAGAAVPRRQRREGGPAAVPIDAAPYKATQSSAQADARAGPGQRWPGQGPGRALRAAGRGQRGQQAGVRQRGGGAEGRPRPRWPRPGRHVHDGAASTWAMPRSTAPISGRIGRALVTEGALVGQGEATPAGHDPADQPDVRQLHPVGRATC